MYKIKKNGDFYSIISTPLESNKNGDCVYEFQDLILIVIIAESDEKTLGYKVGMESVEDILGYIIGQIARPVSAFFL